VIQETLHATRVQVVLDAPLDEALSCRIMRGVRARLGAGVAVTIERVAAIAPEASGKFRYVVSKVDAARNYGARAP
jgi:phenylacetate-CoA ligase